MYAKLRVERQVVALSTTNLIVSVRQPERCIIASRVKDGSIILSCSLIKASQSVFCMLQHFALTSPH